jgi:hypothetical protein
MQGGNRMNKNRWAVAVPLIIAGLVLSVWLVPNLRDTAADPVSAAQGEPPVRLETIDGSDFKRVILSAKAAERLDVQTSPVREEQVGGMPRTVIPAAAVLYGTNGETWTYTSPEPLVFVRQTISVERIDGDLAILSDGPPTGTAVAVVGVPELFGAETGWGGSGGH